MVFFALLFLFSIVALLSFEAVCKVKVQAQKITLKDKDWLFKIVENKDSPIF